MVDPMFTKSSAPAAVCTTERSSHGHLVPFSGVASSPRGDVLVAGSSLIWLLLVVLAIQSPGWILRVCDGIQSFRSMTSASLKRLRSGGTANE